MTEIILAKVKKEIRKEINKDPPLYFGKAIILYQC